MFSIQLLFLLQQSVNINSIHVLNGTNFKNWKENVMIVFGCMDLNFALREERPSPLNEKSSTDDKVIMEKWDRSNRMSLMIMKRFTPETFRGSVKREEYCEVP